MAYEQTIGCLNSHSHVLYFFAKIKCTHIELGARIPRVLAVGLHSIGFSAKYWPESSLLVYLHTQKLLII